MLDTPDPEEESVIVTSISAEEFIFFPFKYTFTSLAEGFLSYAGSESPTL